MRCLVVLACASACGRLGFEPVGETGSDAGSLDGDAGACTLGPWSAPVHVLNATGGAYSPSITADGLELYGNDGNSRMFVATRASRADAFSAPMSLPTPPATAGGSNYDPSISDDGLTLYFAHLQTGNRVSSRPSRTASFTPSTVLNTVPLPLSGDMSSDQLAFYADDGIDLFVARRSALTDSFGAAVKLPAPVSSGANDLYPSISSDERELYFTSQRTGQHQVFVATRADAASAFTNAVQLDLGPGDHDDPDISADGRELYVASDEGAGFEIRVLTRSCQ